MANQIADIIDRAGRLPDEDKMRIVEALLEQVGAVAPETIDAWIREGEDRLAAYERGEISATDAQKVLAKHLAP
jgi:hypothetical protein